MMWLLVVSLALADDEASDAVEAPASDEACTCEHDAPSEEDYRVEFSFGSSLLFPSQPLASLGDIPEVRRVAVPAMLMLGEYRFTPRWSAGAMLSVPTATIRELGADGEVVERHSAAAVAIGGAFNPVFHYMLEDRALLRVQVGALAGRSIRRTGGDTFFPLLVVRPSISTPGGFSIYAGAAYAFSQETLGLIYGVSQRF